MGGCFRNVLASIGCLTILGLTAVGAWEFRDDLGRAYRAWRHSEHPRAETPQSPNRGVPSAAALKSARSKETQMGNPKGPAAVTLTPDEVASLVDAGLDPAARRALDSVRVNLELDRFGLEAKLNVDLVGRDILGPFAMFLDSREPVVVSGPASVKRPGVMSWAPDAFTVRSFSVPGAAVPRLINSLTHGTDGTIAIPVPATVASIRVRPDGITFYRRSDGQASSGR